MSLSFLIFVTVHYHDEHIYCIAKLRMQQVPPTNTALSRPSDVLEADHRKTAVQLYVGRDSWESRQYDFHGKSHAGTAT
jgi:hypothetical protein